MISLRSILALSLGLPIIAVRATQYSLVKQYAGAHFFDGWDFYGNYDNLTNGDAIFVTASQAASQRLAFVNSAGNAIMKVDNKTNVVFNDKRNTVRISSKDRFAVGSVWIADMLHVPYGCSVWPAFWSQALDWPTGGEIDTFEAVNMESNSQISLHTVPGCTVVNAVQTSTLVNTTDCSFLANQNSGCAVGNPDPNSYGAAFAATGGGVFVTEFAETGISLRRGNVPNSLQGNASSVDTSSLGKPVANYPTGGCNVDRFFQPQKLIFDITLCGDFAGNPQTFAQTCSGFCYQDYVIGSPSNYDNAYFEVRSVRIFGTSPSVDITPGSSGASQDTTSVLWLGLTGLSATLLFLLAL
ncbi:glycoside hydrolase family 16 protein [Multifurca ochricompacta]|uniref:Glycoside hydrolase family 16 protein n=1 Tax=Multifurca ochricompacta TaxID=376703 RepID=A0AAD4QJI6_9AGAM|nr:glycoside hydrolase family 16 protein [Multifurca ochricompacta]